MEDNKLSKKSVGSPNYYKYTTFVLLGFLIVFGLFYFYNNYQITKYEEYREKGMNEGFELAVFNLINNIEENGVVMVGTNEKSYRLYEESVLPIIEQNVLNTILNFINEEGSVIITDSEGNELILVPYTQEFFN